MKNEQIYIVLKFWNNENYLHQHHEIGQELVQTELEQINEQRGIDI